jgi:hypothetical protein
MRVDELIWPQNRIDHIASHGIKPDEVEEVCFGERFGQRGKSEGQHPVYYVLGQPRPGDICSVLSSNFPEKHRLSRHGARDDGQRETSLQTMEKQMNDKLPDSIQELAKFWDRHDLTDFEDELEEARDSVFDRSTVVKLHLSSNEAKAVEEIARTRGVDPADLIHKWVAEKSQRP